MIVRALRKHFNGYGDKFTKHPRKQYEVDSATGRNLINAGLVEEVVEDEDDS